MKNLWNRIVKKRVENKNCESCDSTNKVSCPDFHIKYVYLNKVKTIDFNKEDLYFNEQSDSDIKDLSIFCSSKANYNFLNSNFSPGTITNFVHWLFEGQTLDVFSFNDNTSNQFRKMLFPFKSLDFISLYYKLDTIKDEKSPFLGEPNIE